MKVKIIFSIFTKNENDVEEATRKIAAALNIKQVQFDTLVAECDVENVGYFVQALLDREYRHTIYKLDKLFRDYSIAVNGIRIDCSDYAKNELSIMRTRNLESRKSRSRSRIKEAEEIDRSLDKFVSHLDEAFELAEGNLPESNQVYIKATRKIKYL